MDTTTIIASWIAAAFLATGGAGGPPVGAADAEPAVLVQAVEPAVSEAETSELEVGTIVARVQAFYDGVQDYRADFEQRYTNMALGDTFVSTGQVYFKKPGRMRWDYVAPQPKHLISNGETLWMYEPEFDQVCQTELGSNELPTAIRFLMGEGNLAEDFAITLNDCSAEGAYCLGLVPRASQGHYRSLEFIVDADDYSVRSTTIIDPVGNTNSFSFTNVATSDVLPAEGFEFTPTEEMRVICQ